VRAGERPDGWTGKAWACEVGVRSTTAELVVLLDADVWLAPGALAALVDEHERRGGLLSVLPEHRTERAYEQLSLPCNLVSVMGTGAAEPGAEGRADGAFGPCLAIRRSALEAIGGFTAVAGDVVEDLALARRAAASGLATTALAGGDLVAFRMYPDGPAQLAEGWTKNLAAGAAAVPRWRAALVAAWVAAGLAGPLGGLRPGARRRWPALLAWLAGSVQFAVLARRVGRFRWWAAPAHPVLLAGFTGLVGRSTLARRRGHVTWRGRQVAVGRARGPAGPSAGAVRRSTRSPAALVRLGSLAMRARL
jgi:4,4'-diaponeurosporenoate glycosyltransferase